MNYYRLRQEQKALKRAQALEKEGPPITLTFGDEVVVLTKQPMQWDYPAGPTKGGGQRDAPCGQKFKALYKVEHNGVHRGWIVSMNGWGQGTSLRRLDRNGGYNYYSGAECVKRLKTEGARDKLAAIVPALVREGRLGTLDEQAEQERQEIERRKKREAETEQWRADARAKDLQEAEAKRTKLVDDIVVLTALLKSGVLTNIQTDVISRTVDDKKAKVEQITFAIK